MWWAFLANVLSALCFSSRDTKRFEAACVIQRAFRRARPRWRQRRETERLFYLSAETGGSVISFGALW